MKNLTIKGFPVFRKKRIIRKPTFTAAMNRKLFLTIALFLIATVACQAWDDNGHLLIDEIAARKLKPEIIKKMEALIPLLDTRFSEGTPYNLVTAGLWLDDMRALGKDNPWSTWHYIDVPCDGNSFREPPPPNAFSALEQATTVLQSKYAAPKLRAEALAQIMHIVGDIHQPLHTATRSDRGGNDVPISPLILGESNPSNLHAFWDAAYRYDAPHNQIIHLWRPLNRRSRPHSAGEPGVIAEKALAFIAQAPEPPPVPPHAREPWRKWTRETHAIACKYGWPQEAFDQSLGLVTLTPAFVRASHEIATQQIVTAGERLAALLNELLADAPAPEEPVKSETQETAK